MSIPYYDHWKTGGLSAGTREPEIIAYCEHCNEPIYDYEEYWNFDGDRVHDDCLTDWLERQPGIERHTQWA